jgi:hypothetical protein
VDSQQSTYFLSLLSSNSVSRRGFYQKELKMALDLLDELPPFEILIIPVRINECIPLDDKLQHLQWIDLFPSYEEGLKKIIKVIATKKIALYHKHDKITNKAESESILKIVKQFFRLST